MVNSLFRCAASHLALVLMAAAGHACSSDSEPTFDADAGVDPRRDGGIFFIRTDVPLPPGPPPNLFSITGLGPDHVYIVGEGGFILHGQAGAFLQETSTSTADLRSVWARSPEDVFAVGVGGTILHATQPGGPWIKERSGTTADLNAVRGDALGTATFAVGADGLVLRRDPTTGWAPIPSGTFETLHALWVEDGAGLVTVVGNLGTIVRLTPDRAPRSIRVPGLNVALHAIEGPSRGHLYIAGLDGTLIHAQGNDYPQVDRVPRVFLRDVWSRAEDLAFAVGWGGMILRTNGLAVTSTITVDGVRLEALWGPDATRIYAVGVSGTVLVGP